MSRYWVLSWLLTITICSCQKASGVSNDSDTSETVTDSDDGTEDSGDTVSASDTNESSSDDSPGDSETESETEAGSETTDTASETNNSTSDSETETVPETTDTASDTVDVATPVENEWIFIEGGSFDMGYDDFSDQDKYKPRHSVSVPSFEIQKTEVTIYQYRQCVDAGACTVPQQSEEECAIAYRFVWSDTANPNHPISCIDHTQAKDYCIWIGGRLLSEAEWEYAARSGGQDILYPWGNDEPNCSLVTARVDWSDYLDIPNCWSMGPSYACSKPAGNSFHGLCDMSGNYQEWVADKVHTSTGYDGAPTDGSPWIQDVPYAIARGSDAFQIGMPHHVFLRSPEPDDSAPRNTSVRCGRKYQ